MGGGVRQPLPYSHLILLLLYSAKKIYKKINKYSAKNHEPYFKSILILWFLGKDGIGVHNILQFFFSLTCNKFELRTVTTK